MADQSEKVWYESNIIMYETRNPRVGHIMEHVWQKSQHGFRRSLEPNSAGFEPLQGLQEVGCPPGHIYSHMLWSMFYAYLSRTNQKKKEQKQTQKASCLMGMASMCKSSHYYVMMMMINLFLLSHLNEPLCSKKSAFQLLHLEHFVNIFRNFTDELRMRGSKLKKHALGFGTHWNGNSECKNVEINRKCYIGWG